MDNPNTIFDDKLVRTLALYARWEYKNTKNKTLKEKEILQVY